MNPFVLIKLLADLIMSVKSKRAAKVARGVEALGVVGESLYEASGKQKKQRGRVGRVGKYISLAAISLLLTAGSYLSVYQPEKAEALFESVSKVLAIISINADLLEDSYERVSDTEG